MKQIVFLIFYGFVLINCAKVETVPTDNTNANSNKIVSVSPAIESETKLKPITPKVRLNSEQKKYLDESLPLQVREVLEKAEKFEVLAEVDNEPDGLSFEPNRIVKIIDENAKKEILESFYYDASDGPYPSACYIPHHGIRANYKGKTVEIEICYQCHLFFVKGSFGKFEGGILRDNIKSESILTRIIQNQSVEIK